MDIQINYYINHYFYYQAWAPGQLSPFQGQLMIEGRKKEKIEKAELTNNDHYQ